MKKVFLTIAIALATLGQAQTFNPYIGGGFFAANQDNSNGINLSELREWDGFQSGVKLGDWMTKEQLDEFTKRTDGRLFGAHVTVGSYVNLLTYDLQGVESKMGLNFNLNLYHQTTNSNYNTLAVNPSVGLFFDMGFRIESGVQKYSGNTLNWFLDLDAPIINDTVHIYARYQRANPFTNNIEARFALDNSPLTLETFSAGIRIKF